jgi:hypothetical protein
MLAGEARAYLSGAPIILKSSFSELFNYEGVKCKPSPSVRLPCALRLALFLSYVLNEKRLQQKMK